MQCDIEIIIQTIVKIFFDYFQVISGLVHCHNHLLLHLDVKPANIIVHISGKTCKLSDFGCSRTATISQNGLLIAGNETTNAGFGTIAYKAPELLKVPQILTIMQFQLIALMFPFNKIITEK